MWNPTPVPQCDQMICLLREKKIHPSTSIFKEIEDLPLKGETPLFLLRRFSPQGKTYLSPPLRACPERSRRGGFRWVFKSNQNWRIHSTMQNRSFYWFSDIWTLHYIQINILRFQLRFKLPSHWKMISKSKTLPLYYIWLMHFWHIDRLRYPSWAKNRMGYWSQVCRMVEKLINI